MQKKEKKSFWKNPWFYLLSLMILPVILVGLYGEETSDGVVDRTGNWEYFSQTNKMNDNEDRFASTNSVNEIELEFPYSGGTTFSLTIRKSKEKEEILLTCNPCQIMGAGEYDTETLIIRIDEKPSLEYGYRQPSDYSSDAVFISNPSGLIEDLKSAKKAMIQVPLYQEGNKVVEFETDGLVWE